MKRLLLLSIAFGLLAAPARLAAEPARNYWYTVRPTANSPAGDFAGGEDPAARAAALAALGNLNGSVVVVDADTGRIVTMVNQKLALSDGYIPCSTIKLVIGLAALSEGVIEPAEKVFFPGDWFMTMVEGLAISNNVIFDHLGERLGFERVRRYARLFGFGEKAGWRIPGEQLARFPEHEHRAGVGRMSTFGDGISVSPVQLAAFTAALANRGALYYLQHPANPAEAVNLRPRLKRSLPIAAWLPEVEHGMAEAVKRGTGRKANVAAQPVWGKTGTCSLYLDRSRTRLGWFASYSQAPDGRRFAVVVMLRGGTTIFGPLAAEVAGNFYRDWYPRLDAGSTTLAQTITADDCDCAAAP